MSDIATAFAALHRENPSAFALVEGERRWTRRELFTRAAALASQIRERTNGSEPRHIGLLMPNSAETNAALLAVWLAGGIAVPLNPEMTDRQLAGIFDHAEISLILGDRAAPERAEAIALYRDKDQRPRRTEIINAAALSARAAPQAPGVADANALEAPTSRSLERPAAILYTSGTTGAPKGVVLSHYNLLENARGFQQRLQLGAGDRVIQLLPLFHSFGIVAGLLTPLIYGAGMVCVGPHSASDVLHAITDRGVTVMVGVSGYYHLLCRSGAIPRTRVASRLRFCMAGGGPLHRSLARRFHEIFGVRLDFSYGLTEASPIVTLTFGDQFKPDSVGPPLPNCQVAVRDAAGRAAPPGEIGGIFVRGPNVMLGYHRDEEATRQAVGVDGWLKSNDLGRLDEDGFLYVTGRDSDMICVNGQNVFPQDIEIALQNHPGLRAAAVVGAPDIRTGEEAVAFVEAEPGVALDESQLRRYCLSCLAPYQTPRTFRIVESLPRNAMGKIQRFRLREWAAGQSS